MIACSSGEVLGQWLRDWSGREAGRSNWSVRMHGDMGVSRAWLSAEEVADLKTRPSLGSAGHSAWLRSAVDKEDPLQWGSWQWCG